MPVEIRMPEEHHKVPCEPYKSFKASVIWAISIISIVGGGGLSFAINQSNAARGIAQEAKDKAQNITVVQNDINHIKEDMGEMKEALASVASLQLAIEKLHSDIRVMGEQVENLERGE